MTYQEAKKISTDEEELLRNLFSEANDYTYRRLVEVIFQSKFLKLFINNLYFFQSIDQPTNLKLTSDKNLKKEKLVALNKYDYVYDGVEQLHPRLFVLPELYMSSKKGSTGEIYVRESALSSLIERLSLLPQNYGFIIYDGFRTKDCQQDLYDETFATLLEEEKNNFDNRNLSPKEIEELVKSKIMPNYVEDPSSFFEHNTGGAIDCRICDMNGISLNYGNRYDELTSPEGINYYEDKLKNEEQMDDYQLEALLNRRVTTNIFRYATNTPNIDYHIDIIDKYNNKLDKIYGSCEKDNIEPDPEYTIENYLNEHPELED